MALSGREAKAGTNRKELKQRPWRNTDCPSPWACPVCFLLHPMVTYLGWHSSPTPTVWTHLHQSLIKKLLQRLAYKSVLYRHFTSHVPSSQITLTCIKLSNWQKTTPTTIKKNKQQKTWQPTHGCLRNCWKFCLNPKLKFTTLSSF